jgi:ribosomal-protein-alanine N-acetyltransferase
MFEKDYLEKNGIVWALINKESGKFMGHFAFFHIKHDDCRCEVGYMMLPEFWNKGLMTEALKKMIPLAFGPMNFHSIEANLNPGNEASRRILEKLGFEKEGYFKENFYFNGTFIDSLIYSLLEKNFKKD